MLEPGQEARQRARKVSQRIGPDRQAERAVVVEVAVGVHHDPAQPPALLGFQPFDGVRRERLAVELLQSLVHPAHARATTAGKHQRIDLRNFHPQPPI